MRATGSDDRRRGVGERAGTGGGRGTGRSSSAPPPSSRGGGRGPNPIPLIKACRDLGELEALVEAEAGAWSRKGDSAAMATALNLAAKFDQRREDEAAARGRIFSTLVAAYLPLVEGVSKAADCTISLHACAKAGYWGGGLAAALLQRLSGHGGLLLGTADEQALSNLWWSLSEALKSAEGRHVLSSIDLPRLLEASAKCLLAITHISTRPCSNILLATARLQHPNAALTHHLTARLASPGNQANCQDLANALYALGELAEDVGHTPRPGDLQGLARAVVHQLSQGVTPFKPQELTNMLLGCARLGYTDARLLSPLVAAAARATPRMEPQHLANSLYSLALLQPSASAHGGAAEALAGECKRRRFKDFAPHILGAGEGRQGSLLGAAKAAAEKGATEEAKASGLERRVASALQRLAERLGPGTLVSVQRGCVVPGLGRAADVVVELAGGRRVVVEVDGPWHFLANRPRNPDAIVGRTELRNRQLGRVFGAGNVLSVPFWEWDFKGASEQHEAVLSRLLATS
ncbi:hypothetical protein HYH03_004112 [Edaphochlamys debaryana]|uniref:RAP domain-containing protein n=1 Tax=Edaphochlamys debaryana TaxID=47281 RepID=A0A836C2H2_9CHLO|nr:hypothetical protein HYH03_004112 [Edaphochlamys debaryana]|eukprot:KAG2497845.1 hypothetical protein HYH03_004112 [Edaphochlamys debaryana]